MSPLQAAILFFGRLVHRPTILTRVRTLHKIGDPPNEPLEPVVERVGMFRGFCPGRSDLRRRDHLALAHAFKAFNKEVWR
jgi:hypothetical protein